MEFIRFLKLESSSFSMYRYCRALTFKEPRNRFLSSVKVYKFVLWNFRTINGGQEPSCRIGPPAYVAWRAGTTILFLLGSQAQPPQIVLKFQHWRESLLHVRHVYSSPRFIYLPLSFYFLPFPLVYPSFAFSSLFASFYPLPLHPVLFYGFRSLFFPLFILPSPFFLLPPSPQIPFSLLLF